MKKAGILAFCLVFGTIVFAAGNRVGTQGKPTRTLPYPPHAKTLGIEGNVVLTGDVSADGRIGPLKVLASSSPELTATATDFVSSWTFTPAKDGGKPVPVTINAVVRFRKDSTSPKGVAPGTLNAPIVGNLVLAPSDANGKASGPEGFALDSSDGGVVGMLDLDFPASTAPRTYHVAVEDQAAAGKTSKLAEKTVTAGGTGQTIKTITFRRLRKDGAIEKGAHTVRIVVDGANAGGGVYRVL